jgi:hypothetical protein
VQAVADAYAYATIIVITGLLLPGNAAIFGTLYADLIVATVFALYAMFGFIKGKGLCIKRGCKG